jgi:hypothetical protein
VYFEKYENLEVYIGNSTSREVYFRSFPFNFLGLYCLVKCKREVD